MLALNKQHVTHASLSEERRISSLSRLSAHRSPNWSHPRGGVGDLTGRRLTQRGDRDDADDRDEFQEQCGAFTQSVTSR